MQPKTFTSVAAIAFALLLSSAANAQLSVGTANSLVTINFDSTITGVSNGAWAGTGFQATPSSGQLDSDAWAFTGWSDGALAFGGTRTTASTDYTRGSSAAVVTTGGMYAFTASPISGAALGFQPGGSDWAPGTTTLKIQNNTGSTVTGVDFAYDLYVRNDQARSNSFNVAYSTDGSTFVNEGTLDYTSAAASDALGFVKNAKSASETSLSILNGAFFYLRWSGADVGGSGSRDEFALDNIGIKLVVQAVPEPLTAAGVILLASRVLGRRARVSL